MNEEYRERIEKLELIKADMFSKGYGWGLIFGVTLGIPTGIAIGVYLL